MPVRVPPPLSPGSCHLEYHRTVDADCCQLMNLTKSVQRLLYNLRINAGHVTCDNRFRTVTVRPCQHKPGGVDDRRCCWGFCNCSISEMID
jgi:hypothetical protein